MRKNEFSLDLTKLTRDYDYLPSQQKMAFSNPSLKGHHYRIECKTRMAVVTMKGYLDNMARAAVARQCELAKAPN